MDLCNICPEEDRWRAFASWGPEPSPPAGTSWRALMLRALRLAGRAARLGEVPVGALVVDAEGNVLSCAHNETESLRDPTAHAEVLALRRAAAAAGNHRLGGSVLVVTLEPCLMCTGALREARVSGVVFGASDARAGAVCSASKASTTPVPAPRPGATAASKPKPVQDCSGPSSAQDADNRSVGPKRRHISAVAPRFPALRTAFDRLPPRAAKFMSAPCPPRRAARENKHRRDIP